MTLQKYVLAGLMLALALAQPAFAQAVDLSPIETLLQGIVDVFTSTLGRVIATLAVIACLLGWLFGYMDFSRAMWTLVAIVGIAFAPTIVAGLFA